MSLGVKDPSIVRYKTELRVALVDDGHWRLLEPFVADVDGEDLVVPPGFLTDFDSVPKLPVVYMAFSGSGKRAAVLHDYLYSRGGPREFKDRGRRWADRLFWAAMMCEGIDTVVADAKYLGVRVGGESHWEEPAS